MFAEVLWGFERTVGIEVIYLNNITYYKIIIENENSPYFLSIPGIYIYMKVYTGI